MNAPPMFSGSAVGGARSSAWRFSHSPTMRCERSAMSAIERPSSAGSGSRKADLVRLLRHRPSRASFRRRGCALLQVAAARRPADRVGAMPGQGRPRHMMRAGCCGVSRWPGQGSRAAVAGRRSALGLLLGGCVAPPSFNPVDWWHELEGGADRADAAAAAECRRALSEPRHRAARPPPANAAAQARIASALLADRGSAQYAAIGRADPDPAAAGRASRAAACPGRRQRRRAAQRLAAGRRRRAGRARRRAPPTAGPRPCAGPDAAGARRGKPAAASGRRRAGCR